MRNQTSEIIDNFLKSLVLVGALSITVMAPNAVVALEKPLMSLLKDNKNQESKRIGRYLKRVRLVKVSANSDGSFTVTLTDKGKTRASKIRFECLSMPQQPWDKRWRIVMFDIPEKHKSTRDYISFHLKRIGFKQLQRSVFVYPHPVDDFIELVRELFPEAARHIIVLTTSEIDVHNSLVKTFAHIL